MSHLFEAILIKKTHYNKLFLGVCQWPNSDTYETEQARRKAGQNDQEN
jgi:hypothetical protein